MLRAPDLSEAEMAWRMNPVREMGRLRAISSTRPGLIEEDQCIRMAVWMIREIVPGLKASNLAVSFPRPERPGLLPQARSRGPLIQGPIHSSVRPELRDY